MCSSEPRWWTLNRKSYKKTTGRKRISQYYHQVKEALGLVWESTLRNQYNRNFLGHCSLLLFSVFKIVLYGLFGLVSLDYYNHKKLMQWHPFLLFLGQNLKSNLTDEDRRRVLHHRLPDLDVFARTQKKDRSSAQVGRWTCLRDILFKDTPSKLEMLEGYIIYC